MTRGHVGWVALLCWAASGWACASRNEGAVKEGSTQQGPAKEDSAMATLQCVLSVAERRPAGEPVELLFRLHNPTERPLSVLRWHTPLEGPRSNSLQVTRDGVEVPYEGPMIKRGDPQATDYVTLPPGASVEARIDVSLAYDLRQPGRYRIAFRGQLMDVAEKEAELPRPLAQHRAASVQCPAVETMVVASAP